MIRQIVIGIINNMFRNIGVYFCHIVFTVVLLKQKTNKKNITVILQCKEGFKHSSITISETLAEYLSLYLLGKDCILYFGI